jgi:uncharacterized SAM-binding protein YcdF (DUF218 family)
MNSKYLEGITEFIFVNQEPKKSDIIFVPGNGYPQMAEQAAALWKNKMAPYILVSGKYSITRGAFSGVMSKKNLYVDKYETEGDFLRDVLIKNGVPEDAVLVDRQATYTLENAIYSRKITDELGLNIKTAMICCKNYHARRSLMYYQLLFPDTAFYVIPSQADEVTPKNWYKQEHSVKLVLGEMERCAQQFENIIENKDPRFANGYVKDDKG